MIRIRLRNRKPVPVGPMTSVELFFDMVFVFAFTLPQLTGMLERDLSLAGVSRMLVLFGSSGGCTAALRVARASSVRTIRQAG